MPMSFASTTITKVIGLTIIRNRSQAAYSSGESRRAALPFEIYVEPGEGIRLSSVRERDLFLGVGAGCYITAALVELMDDLLLKIGAQFRRTDIPKVRGALQRIEHRDTVLLTALDIPTWECDEGKHGHGFSYGSR